MPRRTGGRPTARYSSNSDLHGRIREARFDLDPSPPPYQPSPQEAAEAAFKALSQQDQTSLTGWAVASLSKATPRAPWDGSPKTGLLKASELANAAAQALNRSVTADQIAGACLALGFGAVTSGQTLQLAADWKV